MPRFAANLSMLYNDVDFLDRFAAAARDGFKAVEYLFPYAYPAQELATRLQANGLQQVLFNAPPGNWDAGERGLACLPGREAEFREGIAKAVEYAQALQCPRIHVMAGLVPQGADAAAVRATYIANVRYAAEQAAPHGIQIDQRIEEGGFVLGDEPGNGLRIDEAAIERDQRPASWGALDGPHVRSSRAGLRLVPDAPGRPGE